MKNERKKKKVLQIDKGKWENLPQQDRDETEEAFLKLFEMEFQGSFCEDPNPIVGAFISQIKKIDEIIEKATDYRKKVDSLLPVERSILRVAVSELMMGKDIGEVLNRAVKLSYKYAATNSYKFIKSIVASAWKIIGKSEDKNKK